MCIFLHNTTMLLVNICCEIATVLFNVLSFVFNNHLKAKYRKKIKKKGWFLFFILFFFFCCNFLLIETCNEESPSEFIHTGFTSRPHKSISTRTGVERQTSSSMLTRRLTLRCKSETWGEKITLQILHSLWLRAQHRLFSSPSHFINPVSNLAEANTAG